MHSHLAGCTHTHTFTAHHTTGVAAELCCRHRSATDPPALPSAADDAVAVAVAASSGRRHHSLREAAAPCSFAAALMPHPCENKHAASILRYCVVHLCCVCLCCVYSCCVKTCQCVIVMWYCAEIIYCKSKPASHLCSDTRHMKCTAPRSLHSRPARCAKNQRPQASARRCSLAPAARPAIK